MFQLLKNSQNIHNTVFQFVLSCYLLACFSNRDPYIRSTGTLFDRHKDVMFIFPFIPQQAASLSWRLIVEHMMKKKQCVRVCVRLLKCKHSIQIKQKCGILFAQT